jgi:GNAT superfamily N-acetyltransferase
MAYCGGRIYDVFCSHPERSSEAATLRSLHRKLHASQEHDDSDEDASTLNGNDLPRAGALTTCLDEEGEATEAVGETAHLAYRLVVAKGRSAVGYATFTVRLGYGYGYRDGASVEVTVGEVWVQPAHRGIGVGMLLADAVASLTMDAITTVDERLRAGGSGPIPVDLDVVADVHSTSGERFLDGVADSLMRELALLDTGACVELREVAVDARW